MFNGVWHQAAWLPDASGVCHALLNTTLFTADVSNTVLSRS